MMTELSLVYHNKKFDYEFSSIIINITMIGLLSSLFGTSSPVQPANNNPLRLGGVVAGVALAVTAGLFTWRSPGVTFKSTFSKFIRKNIKAPTAGDHANAIKNANIPPAEITTPAIPKLSADSLFARAKALPEIPIPTLETVSHLDRERLVSGNDVAAFVAKKLSQQIFIYPGIGRLSYLGDKLNDREDPDKLVKVLETRIGSGEVFLGAARTGSLVSCLLPSEALLYTLPNIQKIVDAKKTSCVSC